MSTKTKTDASNTITLDQPIPRGGNDITTLTLRKPASGELRGLNLYDLMQMDVTALCKLVPRIATPSIAEADVRQMAPSDLTQIGMEVNGFLLPKSARADAFLAE
ncbi:phage tail assembly protein [Marinimicrobium sp. ARAG 43.8]|uniref:phage tail assembly protein n=1 Tax=Marinimicrobium sp. ARAG 43.8 TaxID=3418719 RepID=UPI003CEBD8FD